MRLFYLVGVCLICLISQNCTSTRPYVPHPEEGPLFRQIPKDTLKSLDTAGIKPRLEDTLLIVEGIDSLVLDILTGYALARKQLNEYNLWDSLSNHTSLLLQTADNSYMEILKYGPQVLFKQLDSTFLLDWKTRKPHCPVLLSSEDSSEISSRVEQCLWEMDSLNLKNEEIPYIASLLEAQLPIPVYISLISQYSRYLYLSGELETLKHTWESTLSRKNLIFQQIKEIEAQISLLEELKKPDNKYIKMLVLDLYRTYLEGGKYPEISQKTLDLLKKIDSRDLRKEIKKTAMLAWDRDNLILEQALLKVKDDYNTHQLLEASIFSLDSLKKVYNHCPNTGFQTTEKWLLSRDTASSGLPPDTIWQQAQSLIKDGHYLKSLPMLQTLKMSSYRDQANKALLNIGHLYCEEKRKKASLYFQESRISGQPNKSEIFLKNAKNELDSCIQYFPEHPVTNKVQKNRQILLKALEDLKNP